MTVGWNSEVAKVTNNTVANMPFGSGTYIFIGGVSSLSAGANKVGNGHIDKFAYFTRRLTDEEVTHHYNSGSGRTYLEE